MWNLTNEEVAAVLRPLTGVPQRMASLLYGSGLRRLGCRPLRIHDIDFARNQIVVRGGKAHKDRVTILPEAAKTDRARHLEGGRAQHQRDFTREPGGSNCPPRSRGSIPMLVASRRDSECVQPRGPIVTGRRASGAGSTCSSPTALRSCRAH